MIVIDRARRPGQARRAPRATNPSVATACQAMWCNGSSPVSHAPMKYGNEKKLRRRAGTTALSVKPNPIRLAARKSQELVSITGARDPLAESTLDSTEHREAPL